MIKKEKQENRKRRRRRTRRLGRRSGELATKTKKKKAIDESRDRDQANKKIATGQNIKMIVESYNWRCGHASD